MLQLPSSGYMNLGITEVASYKSDSEQCVEQYQFDWSPCHKPPTQNLPDSPTLKKTTAMFVKSSINLQVYVDEPRKLIKHTANYKQKHEEHNFRKQLQQVDVRVQEASEVCVQRLKENAGKSNRLCERVDKLEKQYRLRKRVKEISEYNKE
jgi:hypothetical protein